MQSAGAKAQFNLARYGMSKLMPCYVWRTLSAFFCKHSRNGFR